jgi:16S rRNA (guanine527-N7)-methyltransferase
MTNSAVDSLPAVLERYQLSLTEGQITCLERYCRLLWDWNQKLNLTRHTDFERFVTRDLVDCLQLARLLAEGEAVLDVGSGGGVPGVVLCVLRPDLRMTLAESVKKKAAVLEEIVVQLGLPAAVCPERAEHLLGERTFDTLVARAAGPLWKMLRWFAPHWNSIGRLLVIKGPRWVEERGEARHRGLLAPLELRRVAAYPLIGTNSESVILQIWPKGRGSKGAEAGTETSDGR